MWTSSNILYVLQVEQWNMNIEQQMSRKFDLQITKYSNIPLSTEMYTNASDVRILYSLCIGLL